MTNLYSPYRSIGYISDGNPFCLNYLGEELFIVVSIRNSFQVIRYNKLITCMVSKAISVVDNNKNRGSDEDDNDDGGGDDDEDGSGVINAIQVNGHETFVAINKEIIVYDRLDIVRRFNEHNQRIIGLLAIGAILISYDIGNHIKIHNTKNRTLIGELSLLTKTPNVVITALAHPSTYLNKFVIGFSDGSLELWNFNTKKMLYNFQSHYLFFESKKSSSTSSSSFSNGYDSDDNNINKNNNNRNDNSSSNGSSSVMYGISCLEQSPACDVMAIGFINGYLLLLNLKLDQILFSFLQKGGGSVNSLSFRTDAAADRYPYLVSGSEDGRMHIWNLGGDNSCSSKERNKNGDDDDDNDVDMNTSSRKLQCSIDEGHVGAVSRVAFVYGEPTMISIGRDDNSIKVWIFDSPDGTARLLRSRDGHRLPSTRIRYYGGTTNVSMRDNADGMSCELISTSNDGTLRLFNTAIENQNRELSQKPMLKKLGLLRRHERLPECINFDFCETRQRDWGNLVTIHYNHEYAYVWKFKHHVITEMILKPSNTKINYNLYYKDNNKITSSIALSPCGNYCVIGMKGGLIHQYNLQSGLHRNTFPVLTNNNDDNYNDYDYNSAGIDEKEFKKRSATPGNVYHETKLILGEQMKPLNAAVVVAVVDTDAGVNSSSSSSSSSSNIKVITGHHSEVSGLFIDMLSITLISCGYDGLICFWNFQTHHLMHHIQLDSPQIMMHGFKDSNFIAIVSQDSIIRLYDIQTYSLLRRFSNGHSREITDLAFSIDGRRLLSSSLDCTLRVWDIPTGRCLSWLLFDSYIQSMCISLSGEYLCIVQAEKQGIQMYIDRSLYETIYIDKEPTSPIRIASTVVRMDPSIDEITTAPMRHQDRSSSSSSDRNIDDNVDKDNDVDDDVDFSTAIKPAQAHIQTTDERNNIEDNNNNDNNNNSSSTSRGPMGTITYSSIPKAYWTSLFNLEAIKQRNQPILPPAPPPKVPFFLPSIIRNGATTPSFPTPAEYAELTNHLLNKEESINTSNKGITTAAVGEVGVGVKRIFGDDDDDNNSRKLLKKSKIDILHGTTAATTTDDDHHHNGNYDNNDDILKSMEGLGSVWEDTNDDNDHDADDGNDDHNGGVSWVIDRSPSAKDVATTVSTIIKTTTATTTSTITTTIDIDGGTFNAASVDTMINTNNNSSDKTKKSKSKIISKKTKLPRCKLVAFLVKDMDTISSNSNNNNTTNNNHSVLMEYLKQLPPSAIDLEFRALYIYDGDDEGIILLQQLLQWLTIHIQSGENFEILQAYLYRILIIYSDIIIKLSSFKLVVSKLYNIHYNSSIRFRNLIQKNLCLLKMLANLPIT